MVLPVTQNEEDEETSNNTNIEDDENDVYQIKEEYNDEVDNSKNDADYFVPGSSTRVVDKALFADVNMMLGKVAEYTNKLLEQLEQNRLKEQRKKEKRMQKRQRQSNKEATTKEKKASKRKGGKGGDDGRNKSARVVVKKSLYENDQLVQKNFYQGVPHDPDVFEVVDGKRYLKGELVDDEQPQYFEGGIMRDYQIVGYKWLKRMFDNAANGILADEMGLGKTIQCIAQIARLVRCEYPGPYLVCAPLSTIQNWFNEFKRFAPACPVMLYYGGDAKERQKLLHVFRNSELYKKITLITSYEVLMRDRAPLSKTEWAYLIVDEGHRLKNQNCRLLAELKRIPIQTKLLLTGTPLQNNLGELWSLLNFLVPEIFSDLGVFTNFFDFDKMSEHFGDEHAHNFVHILHKTLTPFLLRRIKKDVTLSLPHKREVMVYAPSSQTQIDWHCRLGEQCKAWKKKKETKVRKYNKSSHLDLTLLDMNPKDRRSGGFKRSDDVTYPNYDVESNFSLQNLIMQLRKSCNHPYLLEYPLILGTDFYKIDEEVVRTSGKMVLLDKMLPKLLEKGHKILIFSQMTKMMDILVDYLNLRKLDFYRLDGSTKLDARQKSIQSFGASDSDVSIFLLSTRAGGLGINLTAADTVIIYDSDWNPQNDLQAQDRCHRIGQNRPVVVYRFVLKDTVDEMMVERAQAKRALGRIVITDKKFKGSIEKDLEEDDDKEGDLTSLLQVALKKTSEDKKDGFVGSIDGEKLDKLLDRDWVMNAVLECEGNDRNILYKFVV